MSQIPPEPTEPSEPMSPAELSASPVPPPPPDTTGEETLILHPSPVPLVEPAGVPGEPVMVPSPPPVAPGESASVLLAQPAGPDWRKVSLEWMQKSQEITAKWLYGLGGWIFGGLIIVALMLLQDLISLSFIDHASLVAGLAITIALPFNLAGLGIIRYFNDLNQAVEEARQTLGQSANLDAATLIKLTRDSEAFSPARHKVMDFTVSLALYISVLFTIIGLAAALWRISWAATLLFIIASVVSVVLVLRVIRYS